MAHYQFLGVSPQAVRLPDGSVSIVDPGDVVELGTQIPGPLWQATAGGTVRAPRHPSYRRMNT